MQEEEKLLTGFFITFSGNCKKALSFYQSCFGGRLQFSFIEIPVKDMSRKYVVKGTLISDAVTILGSDLVHDEGRRAGNHMAIFIQCQSSDERLNYINKLNASFGRSLSPTERSQTMLEFVDKFDVRWLFCV